MTNDILQLPIHPIPFYNTVGSRLLTIFPLVARYLTPCGEISSPKYLRTTNPPLMARGIVHQKIRGK